MCIAIYACLITTPIIRSLEFRKTSSSVVLCASIFKLCDTTAVSGLKM